MDRLDLAVVDGASGACVGEAVLNQWDLGNQVYAFNPAPTAWVRDPWPEGNTTKGSSAATV